MCGDAGTFWEISPKYIAISGTLQVFGFQDTFTGENP